MCKDQRNGGINSHILMYLSLYSCILCVTLAETLHEIARYLKLQLDANSTQVRIAACSAFVSLVPHLELSDYDLDNTQSQVSNLIICAFEHIQLWCCECYQQSNESVVS